MKLKECFLDLPTIETTNYRLRNIQLADTKDYKKCIADERVYEFWGRKMSDKEKNVIERIERNQNQLKLERELTWGIAEKESDKIIGEIAVFNFEGTRTQKSVIAEIGYRIAPSQWGQGIMSEVIRAVVEFIFTHSDVKRLQATVMKENIGSKKVLEKNGFTTEGLIRGGKIIDCICDYYILSILKSDYLSD